MIKCFFTIVAVLLFVQSYSQDNKLYARDSAWIRKSKKLMIEMNGSPVSSIRFPFSGFVVSDVRADSSYIGVAVKTWGFNEDAVYQKVVLEKGTSASVTDFFNKNENHLFLSPGVTLTCFIKELRITEVDSVNKAEGNKRGYRRLYFEAEGYLHKDDLYYPALRVDTIAVSKITDEKDFSILANVLNAFAEKAASIDTTRIFKRTAYKGEELDKRYLRRLYKPILQASELNAGVYKNFEEFMRNNPSVKQYEFKKDKKTTILYTRMDGNEWLPERKAFGYCDGKRIWLNVDNFFYPLVRQGYTFEFLANYYTINNSDSHRGTTIVAGSSPLATLGGSLLATGMANALTNDPGGKVVFQLNMENGMFY